MSNGDITYIVTPIVLLVISLFFTKERIKKIFGVK